MNHPHVTVGMPVFNDPDGLLRSVPTVFGQTWQGRLRLLVVDDGSTDDTPEVLASLAKQYGEIDVIRNPENRGRPFARNTIVEHAGDDYLAWIDAGDLWHPRKLELQLRALLRAEAGAPDSRLLCTGPLRWVFADRADQRLRVPQVDGDQLYNALTGTLFPYLQAITGRAEHFRSAGGFDERLLRRQDHDFLVRFLGSGGRLVSSPEHTPVFTYLKSDVGTSADLVATANQVIRTKHLQYYRRYGFGVTRQIRSNQDRLVARYCGHNGRRLQSVAYRARARVYKPDILGISKRAATRVRDIRFLPQAALRRVLRVFRPLLPILRSPGLIDFARRAGLIRLLSSLGVGRTLYDQVKAEVAERDAAAPLGWRPRASDAIERLEEAVSAPGGSDAATWLQLERRYRDLGMMHSAESALRRGLEAYPTDADMLVRLIELLPLRKKWSECTALWSRHMELGEDRLRSLTYARVARSYRELGDHATALAVAEEGLALWPQDYRVLDEVYLNRDAVVDWSRALTGSDGDAEPSDGRAGLVTELGFLRGAGSSVEGWVTPTGTETPIVSLLINGTPIATSHARASTGEEALHFAISAHDARPYLGDGDVISVECEGRLLDITGYGRRCRVATGYESRFAVLDEKLSAGHRFTKLGQLRKANTRKSKRQILELYQQVSDVLAKSHGYTAYPFYGNLLGAIREHDFIAHDIGGFDMGYISRHQTADQVRAEYMNICRTLIAHGFYLVLQPWSVYVLAKRGSRTLVDLNYAWFNEVGQLNFCYGWRYPAVTDRDRVLFPRESAIGSVLVPVPGNAEEVLEQLYGPTWAIPDQGFDVDAGLQRAPNYLLTIEEMVEVGRIDPDRIEVRIDRHPDAMVSPEPAERTT